MQRTLEKWKADEIKTLIRLDFQFLRVKHQLVTDIVVNLKVRTKQIIVFIYFKL